MKRYKHGIIANMFYLALLVFALANLIDTLDSLNKGMRDSGLTTISLFWEIVSICMCSCVLIAGVFSHGIIIHNETIEFKFFYGNKNYKWEEIAFVRLKGIKESQVCEALKGNFFKTKVVNGYKYDVLSKMVIILAYYIFFYFIEDKICLLTKKDFKNMDTGIVVLRMYSKHYEIIQIVLEKTKYNPGIEIDPGVYKLIEKYERKNRRNKVCLKQPK